MMRKYSDSEKIKEIKKLLKEYEEDADFEEEKVVDRLKEIMI